MQRPTSPGSAQRPQRFLTLALMLSKAATSVASGSVRTMASVCTMWQIDRADRVRVNADRQCAPESGIFQIRERGSELTGFLHERPAGVYLPVIIRPAQEGRVPRQDERPRRTTGRRTPARGFLEIP
jgi:hypothetical protein